METLRLKFNIWLDENSTDPWELQGPLFHRWLPDGERDAIALETHDPDAELRVWFERRGFMRDSFIKYAADRREADPVVIPTQAVLEGGPLMGQLTLRGLSDEEVAPLREQPEEEDEEVAAPSDARYQALGRRVVRLVQHPLGNLLDLLRTHYGQYWIRPLEAWDSREQSVGYYCWNIMGLRWSLDGGASWKPFLPDREPITSTLYGTSMETYRQYLSREDWSELAEVVRSGYEVGLAATVLSRAHQLMDRGELRYALIEGVTAFELALDEYLDRKLRGSAPLGKALQAFREPRLPLPAKLSAMAVGLDGVSLREIELAVRAIGTRNGLAHEGTEAPQDAQEQLGGLLKVIAAMLPGPKFRFPTRSPGNLIQPLEMWEQEAGEDDRGS